MHWREFSFIYFGFQGLFKARDTCTFVTVVVSIIIMIIITMLIGQ